MYSVNYLAIYRYGQHKQFRSGQSEETYQKSVNLEFLFYNYFLKVAGDREQATQDDNLCKSVFQADFVQECVLI